MRRLFAVLLLITLPVRIFCQPAESSPVSVLVLKNVTVIDMTGAAPKYQMTVLVENGRITKIGKTAKVKYSPAARVIDGSGKFLIPAFWDMHVHVLNVERMLPLFVANGVLGVRDLGARNLEEILRLRAQSAAGEIIAPRIVTAGKILDGVPQADAGFSMPVKTAEEGRRAVRDLQAKRVDLIKVYDVLSKEAYLAIADEARKARLPFAGHVPAAVTSTEASDAGQKSIEHLGKIIEDSSDAPEKIEAARKEPIPKDDFFAFTTRFGRVYDVLLATYSERKAQEIFAHFRRNKTWQVPTLAVKFSRTFIDELDAKGDPRAKYVEASQLNYWKPSVGFFSRYRTASYITAQKAYFQKEMNLVGEMRRRDVPVMAGTDTPSAYVIAGFSLHDELALLVRAGFSPMDALRAATRSPAEYLGELKTSGTIERGKLANLILLAANPLDDIKNTTKIDAVIQNGRYLSKDALQKMLADVEASAKQRVD